MDFYLVTSTNWNDWHAFQHKEMQENIVRIRKEMSVYDRIVYDQHIRFLDMSTLGLLKVPTASFLFPFPISFHEPILMIRT